MTTNIFKPILFSTEMVQAILAGRKTQTRRVCRHQYWNHSELTDFNINKIFSKVDRNVSSKYQPGDILWVRETWVRLHEAYLQKLDPDPSSPHFFYWYKSDGDPVHFEHYNESWKPSIHMSKEAARIFLKVTNVRVERLQDISEEDAIAEGIVEYYYGYWKNYLSNYSGGRPKTDVDFRFPTLSFRSLWQKINFKKHPWDSNPWVWVYEFERIEKPENFLP